MKKLLYPIVVIFLFFHCKPKPDPTAFYMPAEWEPQEAVYMGWDGNLKKDDTSHLITANIIRELQEDIDVVLWVTSDSLEQAAHYFLTELQVPLDRVEIARVAAEKVFWSRDSAPAFVINKQGERKAIDFNHTGYFRYIQRLIDTGADSAELAKEYQTIDKMMTIDSLVAVEKGEIHEKSWMFVEGGAFDVNGKGSLLVSESFLFRNISEEMRDTLTKKHFEEEFNRTLGVTNVIWLSDGLAEDGAGFFGKYFSPGTNGHADEFARFANENTILLAWVDESEKDLNPMKKASFERMNKNHDILKKALDQDGKPFRIIQLPMPAHVIEDRILNPETMKKEAARKYYEREGFAEGDTLKFVAATSYMNFLFTNGKIILPSFVNQGTSPEREKQVEMIFADLYPDRKLVFLDATYVNTFGGGIHCMTRQVPTRAFDVK
ncbi:agmatine deiminase family protein [Pararhodonellum marinum]|uniref:agmatine deiminase family protein n=1 Tax=Pararhodonellum marinum TaxID=2755358 RepID=UPI00188F37D5|nr:agmatine deiminase family protein [Pararhodonellum marinum]